MFSSTTFKSYRDLHVEADLALVNALYLVDLTRMVLSLAQEFSSRETKQQELSTSGRGASD